MSSKRSQLFIRLRRAIQKVKFILSFNASKWILSSIAGSSSPDHHRRLSYRSQSAGLLDLTNEDFYETCSSFTLSRSTSSASDVSMSPGSEIMRSTSDASSSDDINTRSEDFIARFRRHLQMERQVSLELRYCRDNDFERNQSP